jgi:hypothetical protein
MNNLSLSNKKNVYIGYLNQPVIEDNSIGFDYIRINKEDLTDTVRISGQEGLWFLDTDFSNYYESGNFCVFDYGNIKLTRKPEYVWILSYGDNYETDYIEDVFKTFEQAKIAFDSLVKDRINKCKEDFDKQPIGQKCFAEFKLQLKEPMEDDFGDWYFSYGRRNNGIVSLNKYDLKG